MSSPVLAGDHLYTVSRVGIATCLEARTGKEVWRHRVGGRVLTLREPWADDLYVEAGAARIPDNHDVTLRYVRE